MQVGYPYRDKMIHLWLNTNSCLVLEFDFVLLNKQGMEAIINKQGMEAKMVNVVVVGLKSLVSKRITGAAKDTWKALSMSQ